MSKKGSLHSTFDGFYGDPPVSWSSHAAKTVGSYELYIRIAPGVDINSVVKFNLITISFSSLPFDAILIICSLYFLSPLVFRQVDPKFLNFELTVMGGP